MNMTTKQLTPKMLHFTRCVAAGMTQADAYREAYEPSDSTTAASIHTLASRLMSRVEIRSRVDSLIAARERAVAASAVTDRDKVLSKLRGWMDNAEPTDTAKLRAAELLGKAAGLFTTEVNVTTRDRDASEVAAELQSKLTGLLSRDDDQQPAREAGDEVH